MEANLITALAGVLGSVSGASAAIATTWISQKSQTRRDLAKSETRKRETLYGDFITAFNRRARIGEWHLCGDRPIEQLRLRERPDPLVLLPCRARCA